MMDRTYANEHSYFIPMIDAADIYKNTAAGLGIPLYKPFRKANGSTKYKSVYGHTRKELEQKVKKRTSKFNKYHTEKTIDIFTPHCLRHTFGTMLNNAGVNIKAIQTELGHSDIRTTMNRYVHDNEEHCAKEMKKFFEAG